WRSRVITDGQNALRGGQPSGSGGGGNPGGFVGYLRYFGRLLYLCRISLFSAFAGGAMFVLAPQAQDLFLDVRSSPNSWIGYWGFFYFFLFLFWIFPVYASGRFMIHHCNDHILAQTPIGRALSKPMPLVLGLMCLIALGFAQYKAWSN